MKRYIFSSFGYVLKDYIRKIDCSYLNKDVVSMILQESLFEKYQIPFKVNQCEINSMNLNLSKKEITIGQISLSKGKSKDMESLPNESSNSIDPSKKKSIFCIIGQFLLTVVNFFLIIFNFLFGSLLLKIKNYCLTKIKQKMANTKIIINSIIITPEISTNKGNSFQISITNTNFVLKSIDDLKYGLTIDKIQINISNQVNQIISKIKFFSIKFEGEKMKSLAIELNSIILKNPLNKRFLEPIQIKNQILFSFKHDDNDNDDLNDIKIKVPNIFFVFDFQLFSILNDFFNSFELNKNLNQTEELPDDSIKFIDDSVEFKSQPIFDLEINETKFVLPYSIDSDEISSQSDFVFSFNLMKINNIENSLNYKFLLDSAQFYFDGDDAEITEKINVDINIEKGFSNEMLKFVLNFNSFSILLTADQILLLNLIVKYLMDKINKIKKIESNQINSTKSYFNYIIELMIRSISVSFSYEQKSINKIKITFLSASNDDNNSSSKRILSKRSVNMWQSFVSKDDNLVFELIFSQSSKSDAPSIYINLSSSLMNDDESLPLCLKLKLESFNLNISIFRLLEISQFLKRFTNNSIQSQENKNSANFFNYNVKMPNFSIGVLYDEKENDYYLLQANNINACTTNSNSSSINHRFSVDKLELVDQSKNFSDFIINKLKGTLKMILPEDESSVLNNFKISYDSFDFNYSHQFVEDLLNTTNLVANKNESNQENHKSSSSTTANGHLSFDFEAKNTSLNFLNKEKVSAQIFVDLIHIYIDMKNSIMNVESNKMSLFDNSQSAVLTIYELILNSFSNNFFINLEEFDLKLKLHYLSRSIGYIQNSPLMKLNQNSVKQTNQHKNMKFIDFRANSIRTSIQYNQNLVSFLFSINSIISQNDKIINAINITLLLDEKLIFDSFSIKVNNDKLFFGPISIYFPLYKLTTLKSIIEETKSILSEINEITSQKENFNTNDDDDDDDDEQNENNQKYKINISNVIIFIIKSNSPLFSLGMQPTNFIYPFYDKKSETKIEVKLVLKHFSHGIYNIINQFSIIFTIDKYTTNVLISPIITTLSSFLFEEIFSEERKEFFDSNFKYQDKILFFQNDTNEQIQLTLFKKNSNKIYSIELNNNFPELIKEVEYKPDIEATFNNKTISFSLENLYSPIFLDKTVIVSPNSESGIRTIHFSSPYKIVNKLHYGIEVKVNKRSIGEIESGKEMFIPCILNFSLSSEMKIARFPFKSYFQKIDFTKSEPIALINQQNKKEYYSILHLSFDSEKSIGSITFLPYITFTNYLPISLTLIIVNDDSYILQPNQSVDLSFLKNSAKSINFIFNFHKFAMGNNVIQIKDFKEFVKEVCLFREGKQIGKIILKLSSRKFGNKKIFEFAIYSPLILENHSKMPLSIRESQDFSYTFVDDFIFYSSKSILNCECSIQLPIYSPNLTKDNPNKFQYLGDFSQVVPLKYKKEEELSFLISLTKRSGNFLDSSIVSIQPYLKIINNIERTVMFISSYKYENICEAGEGYIKGLTDDGTFVFSIKGYQKCYNVNLFNIGTSSIRLLSKKKNEKDLLINLVIKKEENGYCCYITYPTLPSPITITNLLTDKSIFIYQHYQNDANSVFNSMEIVSNSTSLFAKEQPFLEEELNDKYNLNISFDNSKQYPFSFEDDCHSKRINNTNYLYDVQTIDKVYKLITIYKSLDDDNKNRLKKKTEKDKQKRNCLIHFTRLQFSFIDKEMNDLFLIAVNDAKLTISKIINFEIGGFAINDLYSASYAPVVLNGLKTPFLNVNINPLKMNKFENISIHFSPIQIFIDFPFIGDLIAVAKEIISYTNKNNEPKENGNNFLTDIISTNQISIEEIKLSLIPKKLPKRKFRFEHPDYYDILHYSIPFEKEYKFTFNKYSNSNVEASLIDLLNLIFDSYKNQITFSKVMKIVIDSLPNKPNYSKCFEDLLNKNSTRSLNYNLEFPIRIPRSFPKRKVLDILPFSNSYNYQFICSLIQFKFQKRSNGTFRDEKLLELYEGRNDKCLAIFENYVYIYFKNDENKSFEIKIADIKKISTKNEKFVIYYGNKYTNFQCKNKPDELLIIKKIESIHAKISISMQFHCI